MGKAKKSTKKFQKNHLKDSISKRRFDKKVKGQEKDKEERKKGNAERKTAAEEAEKKSFQKVAKPKVEDLNVDDFLEGNFFDDDSEDEPDTLGDNDHASAAGAAIDAGDDSDAEEPIAEDSDDEDEEMDEVELHRQQLAALAKSDPEFFAHLQKTDEQLLDFADQEGEGPEEEEEEEEEDTKRKLTKKEKQAAKKKAVKVQEEPTVAKDFSADQLKVLKKQVLQDHSIVALKALLKAFRAACHIADEETTQEDKTKRTKSIRRTPEKGPKDLEISSTAVFNGLMRFCFKHMAAIFYHHMKIDPNKLPASISNHKRWRLIKAIVHSYLTNMIHFLGQLVDVKMIRIVLTHLESVMPFFEPDPKMALKLLKILLRIWSTSEEHARIDSFLRLRQLIIAMPSKHGLLEAGLKGIYLTYVRNAKFVSQQSLATIIFMAKCVVEVYSIDPVSSYQHAFVYLRQLSIHLRNSIVTKTKDSHKSVYNWQFVNSLRVWSMILVNHAPTNNNNNNYLQPLVYPFVQIALGTMELRRSAQYFPLQFQLIGFLNNVANGYGTYIPLSPQLIDTIEQVSSGKRLKKSMHKVPEIKFAIKATKASLSTKQYQDAVQKTATSLLLQHFSCFAYSVAFPEMIVPVKAMLKRLAKNSGGMKRQLNVLLDKLDANVQFINSHRSNLEYSPQDMINNEVSFEELLKKEKGSKVLAPLLRYLQLQEQEESGEEGSLMSAEEVASAEKRDKKEKNKLKFKEKGKGMDEDEDDEGGDYYDDDDDDDDGASGDDDDDDDDDAGAGGAGDAGNDDEEEEDDAVGEFVLSESEDDGNDDDEEEAEDDSD